MSILKKTLGILVSATMFTSLFAGCGGGKNTSSTGNPATGTTSAPQASSSSVKLTWINWGVAEDATKAAFEGMVKGFEAKYPNIKVEQTGYPFNNIKDQLLILGASNSGPDVAQIKAEWASALNSGKLLQPLDEVLDKKMLADYYEGLLNGAKLDGKIMSAPWTPSPVVMYYNKTLAQKAGISAPPKTWSEMIEQAGKIAKLGKDEMGNKIYGLSLASKKLAGAGYFFLVNMWQNGGEFIDDKGKVVINTPANVKALKEVQDLLKQEISPAGLEIKDLRNLFAQGQVGFHFDMEAGVGIFEKGSPKGKEFAKEYGVAQVPGMKDAKGTSIAIEHNLVIFKNSKNQKEAAAFLDFLTGPDGIKIYNDNNGAKLPSRKSVEALEFYKKPENAFMKPFIDALPSCKSLPGQNAEFLKACEEIADSIQRVGLNNEDPAKVTENLEKKVKEIYKQ